MKFLLISPKNRTVYNFRGDLVKDIAGKGYYVNIADGKGTLEITGLDSGSYTVIATYIGDDKYNGAQANGTFTVSKVPSSVNVTAENITVGDKAVIEVSVPEDATGNVTVTVDGKDYNVSVSGGKGILVVPDLEAGNYTVEVKYLGDDKYEESTNATEVRTPRSATFLVFFLIKSPDLNHYI